jgi:hypothetical protein
MVARSAVQVEQVQLHRLQAQVLREPAVAAVVALMLMVVQVAAVAVVQLVVLTLTAPQEM